MRGSARISISVSDSDGRFASTPARWSYPITSAIAGSFAFGMCSTFCALITSGVDACTAATDWWK